MGRGGEQFIPRPQGSRPGAPAPWEAQRSVSLEQLSARQEHLLAKSEGDTSSEFAKHPSLSGPENPNPAAVLVPIFEEDGQARAILTKRPDTMPTHQGEIAFPGGKHEPSDRDLEHTALRESAEEIGLDPAEVEILGPMPAISTAARQFLITPFLGVLDARPQLEPDSTEVVSVFDVTLAELMNPSHFREEIWPIRGGELAVYFFELEGETLWGATARILAGLLAGLSPRN